MGDGAQADRNDDLHRVAAAERRLRAPLSRAMSPRSTHCWPTIWCSSTSSAMC